MVLSSVRDGVADVLYREARLLDQGRYEEWLSLFSQDAVYWMPAWDTETDTVSDPSRDTNFFYLPFSGLQDYVRRIRTGEAHAMVPHPRTARLLGNVEVRESDDPAVVEALCTWLMHEYRRPRQQFHGGHAEYRIRDDGGEYKIEMKKVTVINDWVEQGHLLLV